MARIFYRSWSKIEADYELQKIQKLNLKHKWIDAHKNPNPTKDDIWLTTNGYDYKNGLFKKVSYYAESSTYLPHEYGQRFKNDRRFDHRFHFVPSMAKSPRTSFLNIHSWWRDEITKFYEASKNLNPSKMFGMVLSKKPDKMNAVGYVGQIRTKFVNECRSRSFYYYGASWDKNDPNYMGTPYYKNNRSYPQKFGMARDLMRDAKFVLCLENTYDEKFSPNYMTEKIFHAFLSASVPIYLGAWNIENLVPSDCFIDLRKFDLNPKKCLDYCEKMSLSEWQGYIDRIGKFLRGDADKFSMDSRVEAIDRKLFKLFG